MGRANPDHGQRSTTISTRVHCFLRRKDTEGVRETLNPHTVRLALLGMNTTDPRKSLPANLFPTALCHLCEVSEIGISEALRRCLEATCPKVAAIIQLGSRSDSIQFALLAGGCWISCAASRGAPRRARDVARRCFVQSAGLGILSPVPCRNRRGKKKQEEEKKKKKKKKKRRVGTRREEHGGPSLRTAGNSAQPPPTGTSDESIDLGVGLKTPLSPAPPASARSLVAAPPPPCSSSALLSRSLSAVLYARHSGLVINLELGESTESDLFLFARSSTSSFDLGISLLYSLLVFFYPCLFS
ncbi:hypothetical protein ALC57_13840 [Trachymyrmex cornetzi]|uniref:Uncharacterized protein n=1 Tax=Trachymyrmex cornetzi TaxID=471704 RepID=A0A151IZD2_9HYME|nr:hypothetical protein ALC57_13840 [Trachymyrmex cornetzi]